MKKIFIFVLSFFLLVVLTSCNRFTSSKTITQKEIEEIPSKISCVSPEDDSFIFLTNDDMTEWIKNYTYSSSLKYSGYGDHFKPKNDVLFSWNEEDTSDYYILYISKYPDFKTKDSYMLSENKKVINNLFVSTNYYWMVISYKGGKELNRSKVFKFTTASTPRTIVIDGVSNTRDIGGYMTVFGKKVKQGMVYRCGSTELISELGMSQAQNIYKIKTEFDLRASFDGTGAEQDIVNNHILNGSSFGKNVNYIASATPSYTSGCSFYGLNDIATNHEYDRLFVSELKVFADPSVYPIIFHCAAGRDRTGTMACVLNALLGVLDEDLHIDYETSFFSQSGSQDDSYVPSFVQNFELILGLLYSFEGDTLAEKTANYCMTYGMSQEEINAIRTNLLED